MSYKEVGKIVGLTGERVRQIEAMALEKLRVKMAATDTVLPKMEVVK